MNNTYTVGDLRKALAIFRDDDVLHISGGLSVYRVKALGDTEAVLEFNEPMADLTPEFRKRNPHVATAFIAVPASDSPIQEISVTVR